MTWLYAVGALLFAIERRRSLARYREGERGSLWIGHLFVSTAAAVTTGAKKESAPAGASLASTGKGGKGIPILLDHHTPKPEDSFLRSEMKFAKLWLYGKGVMVPEEEKNPVDTSLESYFNSCMTGKRPLSDLEVGLADSASVMLANQCMYEGRRVYFNEIDKMGRDKVAAIKKG